MKFFLWGFLGTLGFLLLVILLLAIFSKKSKSASTNSYVSSTTSKSSKGFSIFGWLNWENILGWATTFLLLGLVFLVFMGGWWIYHQISTPQKTKITYGALSPSAFDPIINEMGQKYGIDPRIIKAVIQVESGFHPEAVSPRGAMGLMQLMPEIAKRYGVRNAFDPKENIEGGTHYLSDLIKRYNGNLELALAAYNSSEDTVDSLLAKGGKDFSQIFSSLPQETRIYVPAVIAVLEGREPITPTPGVIPAPPEIIARPKEWSPFYSARPGTRLRPTGKVKIQSRTGMTLDVDEDLKKPSRSLDTNIFRVMSREGREVTLLVLEK